MRRGRSVLSSAASSSWMSPEVMRSVAVVLLAFECAFHWAQL
jgi:hypothetical protein